MDRMNYILCALCIVCIWRDPVAPFEHQRFAAFDDVSARAPKSRLHGVAREITLVNLYLLTQIFLPRSQLLKTDTITHIPNMHVP